MDIVLGAVFRRAWEVFQIEKEYVVHSIIHHIYGKTVSTVVFFDGLCLNAIQY